MTATSGEHWSTIEVSASDGIAVVRLNRPDQRNALSVAAMDELTEVATMLRSDTSVHAVVLAGGESWFSAGADISPGETLQSKPETLLERRQHMRRGPDMCDAWGALEQVTIAAIEGHCIGGALALVASCDFRIAARSSWYRLPEVALGIPMTWHSLPRFVALTGPSRTKQLVIFADRVDAPEALSWGLVDELVDDGQAFETAMNWARRCAEQPPVAIRMVKEAVDHCAMALARATIHMDRDQALALVDSNDFREGIDAFMEKRKPRFTGN